MAGAKVRQRKGNLPASVSSLVGRRRETAEVLQLLSASRLVTLTGVGGVGKTRLALHVANARRRAFADGVWWVELAGLTDPSLLVVTVMHGIGLRNPVTKDVSELIEYLKDRQLLLVLDNCEHLVTSCAELVDQLLRAAPWLRVLATSRESLGVAGEHTFAVPPLSIPDDGVPAAAGDLLKYEAVRLFVDRAAAAAPGFAVTADNQQALVRLCQRLDGLPLSIELAAVRTRALTVEQILHRLDDQYELMMGANRVGPARHQTLQAAMDWSFRLCSAHEQLLWSRLAVFASGFDLGAAETICSGDDLTPEAVVEALIGLADKSIVSRDDHGPRGRHRMLEPVRQYGHSRLVERGEEQELRRRHRDYYRALTQRCDGEWFGPDEAEWIACLRAEHANLRAALEFCFGDSGDVRAGLHIASALWFYWVCYGALREGRHWLDRGLALDAEPGPERARALWVSAHLAMMQGDVPAALPMLSECHQLAQEIDDRAAVAHSASFLSMAEMYRDNLARSVALQEEALVLERALGEPNPFLAVSLFGLALASTVSGNIERGVALSQECLAHCEARGETWLRSAALWVLGLAECLRGRTRPAAEWMREAVRTKRELNDVLGIAWLVEVLAWIAAENGEAGRSARLFGASRTLWQPLGAYLGQFPACLHWHDHYEKKVLDALGENAFHAALQRSAELGPEEAIACAWGEYGPPLPSNDKPATAKVLTRRETEVAALVAQGASNKGIADKLVISQRTAEAHVENILSKLGFTSRAQIASWITAQQPLAAAPGTDAH